MFNKFKIASILILLLIAMACDSHQSTSRPNEHKELDQTIKEANSTAKHWQLRREGDDVIIEPINGNPLPAVRLTPQTDGDGQIRLKDTQSRIEDIMNGDGGALRSEMNR
jgi:hypothetical protein